MHEIAIRTIFVLTGSGQGRAWRPRQHVSYLLNLPLTCPSPPRPPSPAPAGFNFNKQTKMLTITSANSQRASKAKPGFKRPIRNSRLSCILIRGFTRVRCYSSCEVGGLPGFTFMHDPRYTKDWLALDEIILLCWPWRVHWRAIEFNRVR